jgi:hypothetical protein
MSHWPSSAVAVAALAGGVGIWPLRGPVVAGVFRLHPVNRNKEPEKSTHHRTLDRQALFIGRKLT